MSTTEKPIKKSVLKERQRIADEVIKLVRQYGGYHREARIAWDAIYPGVELKDSQGRTLNSY